MAKEKPKQQYMTEIRKALEEKKLRMGAKTVLKALQTNAAHKIFISSTTAQDVRDSIAYYAQLNNVPVEELRETNEELGTLCRRQHVISVLAVAK